MSPASLAGQLAERGVPEGRAGRVVRGHRVAVAGGERGVEVGDSGAVLLGGGHDRPYPA